MSESLYKSLQLPTVEQNRSKLESLIKAMKGNLKQRKIKGLLAVLDSLTVPAVYERKFTTGGRCKGYLPFEQPLNLTCILTLCMLEVESMSLWPNRGLNLKKIFYIHSMASVFTFFNAGTWSSLFL